MDEAVHFGHHDVVTILQDYHTKYNPQDPATDKQNAEKNLDGMLWCKTRQTLLFRPAATILLHWTLATVFVGVL